jgi:hypothetical protein
MIRTTHTMKTKLAASLFAGLLYAFSSHAQSEIFFAEDVSPLPPGQEPSVRPAFPNSVRASSNFLDRLTRVSTESFESYSPGTPPPALNFCGFTPTMSGSSSNSIIHYRDPTQSSDGGYPVSGSNAFVLYGGDTPSQTFAWYSISFTSPISAFGLFAIDLELNSFEVVLVHADGRRSINRVPVTVPQGGGGACYFGVISVAAPFSAVELHNIGSWTPDGIVLDDLTVALPEHVIARPSLCIRVSQVELCWDTVTNAAYQLQYRSDLTTNVWVPFSTGYFQGTGGIVCTNDTVFPGEPQRYYQVVGTNLLQELCR